MSDASYAITASFSSLSTDPRAVRCVSRVKGVEKALANLRYISRQQAVDNERNGALIYRTNGITTTVQMEQSDRQPFFELCTTKLKKRTEKKSGKTGSRMLDKAVISLPADANPAQQLEMAEQIVEHFAGESEALVVAAIHIDKPHNPHLHLWMVDGLETQESARARADIRKSDDMTQNIPSEKPRRRVRRRDYIRLGELNSRAQARLDVAAIINAIATRDGLKLAETRSLKEQGRLEKPQIHEGPEISNLTRLADCGPVTGEALSLQARQALIKNVATCMDNHWLTNPKTDPITLEIFPTRLRPFCHRLVQKANEIAQKLRQKLVAEQTPKQGPIEQKEAQPTPQPQERRSAPNRMVPGSDGNYFENMIAAKRKAQIEEPAIALSQRPRTEAPRPAPAPETRPKMKKRGLKWAATGLGTIINTIGETSRKVSDEMIATYKARQSHEQRKVAPAKEDQDAINVSVTAMLGRAINPTLDRNKTTDIAEFERRIDLETGEFLDGDDYVSGASNHDNRPPVGTKAENNSGQTNSAAPAPRREPHSRMTEETARTEESRPPRPTAPISQPTNDKRQAPPVTSSSAQAQSKPNGGEIPPKKRRRDRGYER